jgi:UDP-N-acetylmuramate dehydrogenase
MSQNVKATLLENYNLQSQNTFNVAATARYFSIIQSKVQLSDLLINHSQKNICILGGGSNILFTKDFQGLVIKNCIRGIETIQETNDHIFLKIGAGENWHSIVLYAVERNLAGIENLSLIPGSMGAAPIQNIGAYGVELETVFFALDAIEIKTLKEKTFYHHDCCFGYRDSVFKHQFKNQFIITHVTLRLNKKPTFHLSYGNLQETLETMNVQDITLRAVSDAVIKIRQSKLPDPKLIPNAGSFFKNPIIDKAHFEELQKMFPRIPHFPVDASSLKIPAGWLIEQCKWKGKRIGNVGVHDKQALVVINHNQGTGDEILKLTEKIQKDVKERFAIELVAEVNII